MKTIINLSVVTDNSGEFPVVTYSNPVTTIVNQPTPQPIVLRFFPCQSCNCCSCCCNCRCQCNCCRD